MSCPFLPRVTMSTIILGCMLFTTSSALGLQGDGLTSERPPGDGPTRIEMFFYLIDLMKVIDVDETFEADIFFVAGWQDSRLRGDRVRVVPISEIWTPNVLVYNKRDVSSDLPQVATIQPDGTVVYRQRLTGTFASPLDLRRFPKDSQTIQIQLVSYGTNAEEVVLTESPEASFAQAPDLSIPDWKTGPVRLEADEFEPVPGRPALSRITVKMDVERFVGYYVVQMLVPLILIVAMSGVSFWVNPQVIQTRVSTCVTTVLTLIAYRFMISALMPRLSYLTLADYLLLGVTVLLAASLAAVAIESVLVKNHPDTVNRIDRFARVVHPVSFLLLMVGVCLFR